MKDEERKVIYARVPIEEHRKFRINSYKLNKTMEDIITEFVTDFNSDQEKNNL